MIIQTFFFLATINVISNAICTVEPAESRLFSDVNVVFTLPTDHENVALIYVFLEATTSTIEFKSVVTQVVQSLLPDDDHLLVVAIGSTVSVTNVVNVFNHRITGSPKSKVLAIVALGAESTERAAASALVYLAAKRAVDSVDCTVAKIAPILFTTDALSVTRLNNWVVPLSVQNHWTEKAGASNRVVNVQARYGLGDTIKLIPQETLSIETSSLVETTVINIPVDCPHIKDVVALRYAFDEASVLLTTISNKLVDSGYTWGTIAAVKWLICSSYQNVVTSESIDDYCSPPKETGSSAFRNYSIACAKIGWNLTKSGSAVLGTFVVWSITTLYNKEIDTCVVFTAIAMIISIVALVVALSNRHSIPPTERIVVSPPDDGQIRSNDDDDDDYY